MAKPSQSILVVLGILGIYVFLMCLEPLVDAFLVWADTAPIDNLHVAGVMLSGLLVAWVAYRLTRRR